MSIIFPAVVSMRLGVDSTLPWCDGWFVGFLAVLFLQFFDDAVYELPPVGVQSSIVFKMG